MKWALQRQIAYAIALLIFIGLTIFAFTYEALQRPPSCTDGKQNGTETGIDCGGSCPNSCEDQVSPMSVLWVRSFQVVPGRYNAVAYVVNHNKNSAIEKISYRFRFADSNNIYIGKREGTTFIPPGGNFAIFETAIDVGHSIPVYTTFEFTSVPQWLQVSQQKIDQLKINVSRINLSNDAAGSPRLSATVTNNSLFTVPDAGVVAIMYDADGNAVGVSRTYLPELAPLGSYDINFTWPVPFPKTVVAEELIPMYDIFAVQLK